MNIFGGIVRYVLYAGLVTVVAELVGQAAFGLPDVLDFTVIGDVAGSHRSRERALVERLHLVLLIVCGLIFAWIALRDRLRRPLALTFAGLFLLFLVRELDYDLDRRVAANTWQVLAVLIVALWSVYLFRHRKRLELGWRRSWPSAGLAILIAGLIVLIPFAQFATHDALWHTILPDEHVRAAQMAAQELMELSGYLIITIGSIEFLYGWSRLPETRTIDRPRRRKKGTVPGRGLSPKER